MAQVSRNEIDERVSAYGIPESAIQARLVDVRKSISGTDDELVPIAVRYLCDATEELAKYGAVITWG